MAKERNKTRLVWAALAAAWILPLFQALQESTGAIFQQVLEEDQSLYFEAVLQNALVSSTADTTTTTTTTHRNLLHTPHGRKATAQSWRDVKSEFPFPLDCPKESKDNNNGALQSILGNRSLVLAYHVGMINNWKTIVQDQMKTLRLCGLGNVANQHCILSYANGEMDDLQDAVRPFGLCSTSDKTTTTVQSTASPWEAPGLNAVHARCASHPQDIVFYFHNKGASHYRNDWQSRLSRDVKKNYGNSLYWRKYMEHFLLERPALCLERLTKGGANTCGVMFRRHPPCHYSGNFWAATCSYINTLPPIVLDDPGPNVTGRRRRKFRYLQGEMWIGRNAQCKRPDLHASLSETDLKLYQDLIIPELYNLSLVEKDLERLYPHNAAEKI